MSDGSDRTAAATAAATDPPIPRLVIAISSRALFDLDESNRIFEEEGIEAYRRYQIAREDEILEPGDAFELVRKLLALNDRLPGQTPVEVILLSRNTADTGLRIFQSIKHYELPISRAAFCGGASPYRYIGAFGCQLLLSTHLPDVAMALQDNLAAARILPGSSRAQAADELRFAFDGDAVLFDPEAERLFRREGLEAFSAAEAARAREPLGGGPFKPFLAALHGLQRAFPPDACPIRTALVTARSAPAHERVVRTLREWDIRLDESLFLGGMSKGPFLKAFGADVFFDDQEVNVRSAADHVTAAHVPHPGLQADPPSG